MYQDTIAAISTPPGYGGLGIVRLSGKEALSTFAHLFALPLEPRKLTYGLLRDPDSGEVVDEVMVVYLPAPHTSTREDMVEISCHGSPLVLQRVLGFTLRLGARLAHPGEFTLRAFLNGRIDLAQAESVLDIIQAQTEASLRLAVQGLDGRLSGSVRAVRSQLMEVLAYLAARVDFPEDEVPEQDVLQPLQRALQGIGELVQSAEAGMVYRYGVRTAIVGKPNVGKSSLLNRLLREDRAIVTPVSGTTRDTLEETANIRGVPFVLVDTAGIRKSLDAVENLGVVRSRRAAEQADLVLLVLDRSEPLDHQDGEIMEALRLKRVVALTNKADLPPKADLAGVPWPTLPISAATGQGLEALEEQMVRMALGGQVVQSDALLVTSPRHKAALEGAAQHVQAALATLGRGMAEDFVGIDVTLALNALGEITGETVTEGLLDTIFSRFCIGK